MVDNSSRSVITIEFVVFSQQFLQKFFLLNTVHGKKDSPKVNLPIFTKFCHPASEKNSRDITKISSFFLVKFLTTAHTSSPLSFQIFDLWVFKKVLKMYPWPQKLKNMYFNQSEFPQFPVSWDIWSIWYFQKKFLKTHKWKFFRILKISIFYQILA